MSPAITAERGQFGDEFSRRHLEDPHGLTVLTYPKRQHLAVGREGQLAESVRPHHAVGAFQEAIGAGDEIDQGDALGVRYGECKRPIIGGERHRLHRPIALRPRQ